MRIIDAHAHIWDASRTGQSWLAGTGLPRVRTLEEHPFLIGRLGPPGPGGGAGGSGGEWATAGVVIVEGDPGPGFDDAEATLVAEASSRNPGVVLGYVAPLRLGETDRGRSGLSQQDDGRRAGRVAVRDNCQGLGPEYLRSGAFRRGLAAYAASGQPLELCLHRGQLGALADVLAEFDEPLAIILDHAGKPPLSAPADAGPWERDLRRVAADGRVAVKLSGFYAEAPSGAGLAERRRLAAPFLTRTVEAFGASRAIFGLDWPVSVRGAEEAQAWIEDVLAVVGEDPGVFAENAERAYGVVFPPAGDVFSAAGIGADIDAAKGHQP